MNEDLAQAALTKIAQLERDLAESRRLLAEADAELAKARTPTLQDAIAKTMDPIARQVSKSIGAPTAESVRKASESGLQHDMTYKIRARRAANLEAAEKRR